MSEAYGDGRMSPETGWTLLVVGSLTAIVCGCTSYAVSKVMRTGGWRDAFIISTPNLQLFLAVLITDTIWGTKYALDGFVRVTDMTAGNTGSEWDACRVFGFFEIVITMMRELFGVIYWVHGGLIVWGVLRYGKLGRSQEQLSLLAAGIVIVLASLAIGFLSIAVDWVQPKHPGSWCWYADDNIALVILLGYGWDGVQLITAAIGVGAPSIFFREARRNGGWGRDVKFAFRIRFFTTTVVPGCALINGIVRDVTRTHDNHHDIMNVISAIAIPITGCIEALIFIASEPELLRVLGFSNRRQGFSNALESVYNDALMLPTGSGDLPPSTFAAYGAVYDG